MNSLSDHASNYSTSVPGAAHVAKYCATIPPKKTVLPKNEWREFSYRTVTGDCLRDLALTQINLIAKAAPDEVLYARLMLPIPPPMSIRFPKLRPQFASVTRAAKKPLSAAAINQARKRYNLLHEMTYDSRPPVPNPNHIASSALSSSASS